MQTFQDLQEYVFEQVMLIHLQCIYKRIFKPFHPFIGWSNFLMKICRRLDGG